MERLAAHTVRAKPYLHVSARIMRLVRDIRGPSATFLTLPLVPLHRAIEALCLVRDGYFSGQTEMCQTFLKWHPSSSGPGVITQKTPLCSQLAHEFTFIFVFCRGRGGRGRGGEEEEEKGESLH